jgi:outer membrane lipoprotein-sorting protein
MNKFKSIVFFFSCAAFFFAQSAVAGLTADQMVVRAEKQVRGDSFEGELKMIVEKDGSKRTMEIKSWLRGDDESLLRVMSPAKDRGSGNLRKKLEMWQYLPNVNRVVKIPTSMMLQSWMGSDFSNDDLLKSTTLSKDYTHKILGVETVNNVKSTKIECMPKKDAVIVWGKVIFWLRESDQSPVKQEFYTERGKLVKTFNGFNHRTFGKRTIPTMAIMTPADQPGHRTVLTYEKVRFDHPLPSSLFTEAQLRSDID